MRFERITSEKHKMYKDALALYNISFPFHEQREAASQIKIFSEEEYFFNLIYDDDVFVGLVLCWEAENFIYVEHLCILPEKRNKKYGQKALQLLGQKGKIVILEIDPPVNEISIRRKLFYERSGFVENPYSHVHPPYHTGVIGHELLIMTSPIVISKDEYDMFKKYLDEHVMKNAII